MKYIDILPASFKKTFDQTDWDYTQYNVFEIEVDVPEP